MFPSAPCLPGVVANKLHGPLVLFIIFIPLDGDGQRCFGFLLAGREISVQAQRGAVSRPDSDWGLRTFGVQPLRFRHEEQNKLTWGRNCRTKIKLFFVVFVLLWGLTSV